MTDQTRQSKREALLNERQLEMLLKRVAEVQALFVLVERIVPFVEELVTFVYEVGPMLRLASRSLKETSTKMPKAAQHLHNVSEATEAATSEVLDRVDDILNELDHGLSMVESYRRFRRSAVSVRNQLKKIVRQMADADSVPDDFVEELRELLARLNVATKESPSPSKFRQIFTSAQNGAYEIMNALQVQDITAQQLMAANNLIESVQRKIESLLGEIIRQEDQAPGSGKKRAYDVQARFDYARAMERQKEIDKLVALLTQEIRGTPSHANLEGAGESSEKAEAAEVPQ